MDPLKIIAIAGTNGSGKDTLSDILAEDYGWLFISTSRDLLIPELKRRGLPVERQNMSDLTKEWRQTAGRGVVIDKAVAEFKTKSQSRKYNGLVISSLRHPWEVERLHQLKGKLIWVDADPMVRYKRVTGRQQGAKDQKTFEQFKAEEQAEMTSAEGDDLSLNVAAVKAQADVNVTNDSNSLEDFKQTARQALKPLV